MCIPWLDDEKPRQNEIAVVLDNVPKNERVDFIYPIPT